MSNTVKNPCKVITGKHTVMSYLNVNEPKTPLGGGSPKYSVSLIIPKSDTVTVEKIRAAIKAAYEEGQSKLKGSSKSVPALEDIKTPLRDGDKDRKGDDAYKNAYFVNANSTSKPGVVDQQHQQARRRRCGQAADPRYLGALLRHHRQGVDQLLRLQLERQPRHRVRPEPHPEARRRHPARQQDQTGG